VRNGIGSEKSTLATLYSLDFRPEADHPVFEAKETDVIDEILCIDDPLGQTFKMLVDCKIRDDLSDPWRNEHDGITHHPKEKQNTN